MVILIKQDYEYYNVCNFSLFPIFDEYFILRKGLPW